MQTPQSFALQGGLDLITPALRMPAGRAISALNYEPHPRGYRRCDGYERYDGRPRPSQASYWILPYDSFVAPVEEDDVVTGATSGATGRALVDAITDTQAPAAWDDGATIWDDGDSLWDTTAPTGRLVLMAVAGTFADGEDLEVSASKVAEADGEASERGAGTDELDAAYYQAAIEKTRADIEAVPGSGAVRGAWTFDGIRYAWRDNAGGTALVMHRATPAGWSAIDLGHELYFDAGTAAFQEGETVTGGTSGATATVARVVLQDGDWSTTDGEGKLILSGATGTFEDNEDLAGGTSSGAAVANGTQAAITLLPGGRLHCISRNFYGASDLKRMYGADGKNRGFEFDGEVYVPIDTGMEVDTPTRVGHRYNHLFLFFPGGSAQHSATGQPLNWEVVLGAGEIGLGTDVTDVISAEASAMIVFGREKVAVLLGTDDDNWDLQELSGSAGAAAWTAQQIGEPYYLDTIGVRSLTATQRFGNFSIGTATAMVEPLFREKVSQGVEPVGSLQVKGKDTYRLFWDDGTGISIYFGRKTPEIMPFSLGFTLTCASTGAETDNREVLLAGDDQGFVYELDAGTSFDGEPVPAFLRLPFNHLGSPAYEKRWHKATLEVDSGPSTTLGLIAEYSYADPEQPPSPEQSFAVKGSGGFWNEDLWDRFYWSSPVEGLAEAPLDGGGQNISLLVVSEETYEAPHLIHGLTLFSSARRLKRG